MDAFGKDPSGALARLAEVAMALCGAESGGISVEEESADGERVFRWVGACGKAAPMLNGTIPCDTSPCGLVVDLAQTQLLVRPARVYPALADVQPPVEATLIAPFFVEGAPVGTLWVIDHGGGTRPFDAEDARLLESLAGFATAAWRADLDRHAVRKTEADLRAIIDASAGGFYGVDAEGGTTIGNAAFLSMLGIRRMEDVVGQKLHGAIHHSRPDGSPYPVEDCPIYRAASTGKPAHVVGELFYRYDDGTPFPVEYWTQPILVDGENRGAVTTFLDITDRKAAEAALRTSETRYRTLFDSIEDGFCVIEVIFDGDDRPVDYRFLEINAAFIAQTGLDEADLLGGRTMREMVPTMEQAWFDRYGRVAKTGESIRAEDRAEGMGRWFEVHGFRLGGEGSAQVGVLFKDVTQRREAEAERERLVAELTVERAKLRGLFDQAPAFIAVLTGPDLVFEYVNEAYYRLVGHREILGKTLLEALPEVVGQGYLELLQGVMDTGDPMVGREMAVMLQRERDAAPEERFMDLTYQPAREADGTIYGILAHGVDVTDQVVARREIAALNDVLELRVAERTEQLQAAVKEAEGFNYSIAHDLRSPLRAIASTASILLEELGEGFDEEHRVLLERQRHNANRLGRLIDELLRLSRLARAEVVRARLDLAAEARSVFAELEEGQRCPGCRLEAQEGMVVQADQGLVRTVLYNLIGNACKFSPNGGTIRVRQEGDVLSVSDEGVGFDMAFAPKIFLPFERLVSENEFEGTGIGLANVERIVRRHGGRVWVESEPGKGTTFFFTLG